MFSTVLGQVPSAVLALAAGAFFLGTAPNSSAQGVAPASASAAAPASASASADKAAGERIAREGMPPAVAACISCHGAKGEGSAAFPPLASAGSTYLQAQLDAFASGARANAIMGPIAKAMEPQQRTNVSAWFASLPSPLTAAAPKPVAQRKDAGAWLAQRGDWGRNVPACTQCHGEGGVGVAPHFPPIGGLSAAYMQEQIKAWNAGTRPPGALGLMQVVAKQLTDDDLTAVAGYYAQLHAPATGSGSTASPRADNAAVPTAQPRPASTPKALP